MRPQVEARLNRLSATLQNAESLKRSPRPGPIEIKPIFDEKSDHLNTVYLLPTDGADFAALENDPFRPRFPDTVQFAARALSGRIPKQTSHTQTKLQLERLLNLKYIVVVFRERLLAPRYITGVGYDFGDLQARAVLVDIDTQTILAFHRFIHTPSPLGDIHYSFEHQNAIDSLTQMWRNRLRESIEAEFSVSIPAH